MKKPIYLIITFILVGFITANAQDISINYNNKKQLIDLIGMDMVRASSAIPNAANPQEIINWGFKDIQNMVCRVPYDKHQELTENIKNFSFYDNVIASMKMVKNTNPNIKFFATMKSDYNGYGHGNNLPDWICNDRPNTWFNTDKYALFLADYLGLMNKNGVTINYIAIAKEWSTVNAYRANKIIIKLNEECIKRGIPKPLYVSPATWGVSQGISYVKEVGKNKGFVDLYSSFSTHNLNHQTNLFGKFVKTCESLGKNAYDDETGYGAGGRTSGKEPTTLEKVLDCYSEKTQMYTAGIKGEMIFEPFSRGIRAETRAIYFVKGEKGRRMKPYYIVQKFVNHIYLHNFIAPVISDLSDVKTMSFANDKEIAVWVINNSTTDYHSVNLNLSNVNIKGQVKQYSWDVNSVLQGESNFLNTKIDNKYAFDMKGKSISLIIINLDKTLNTDNTTLSEDTHVITVNSHYSKL